MGWRIPPFDSRSLGPNFELLTQSIWRLTLQLKEVLWVNSPNLTRMVDPPKRF